MGEKKIYAENSDFVYPSSEKNCIISVTFLRKGLSDTEMEIQNLRTLRTLISGSELGNLLIQRYHAASKSLLFENSSFFLDDDFFDKVFEHTVELSIIMENKNIENAIEKCEQIVEWLELEDIKNSRK